MHRHLLLTVYERKYIMLINSWDHFIRQSKNRTVEGISILIFAIFFVISLLQVNSFHLDETLFHYPNALNFYENGFNALFNELYSSANTPLPYIMVAIAAKLTGLSLILARIITGLVSLCAFLIGIHLLKKHGADQYCYFVLLFYPYFFTHSFVFYAINFGLFFALLGLFILDDKENSLWANFLAGACFSLAVLCQQFYLMLPAAIALTYLITALRAQDGKDGKLGGRLLKTLYLSAILFLPLLAPAWLFLQWQGLTHPNFNMHSLALTPYNVTAIFALLGFYFFAPYQWQLRYKISLPQWIICAAAAILLVMFYQPEFTDLVQAPGKFTGITFRIISLPAKISPWLTSIGMFILTSCGLLFYTTVWRNVSSLWDLRLFTICTFLIIAYSFNTQIGERHLLALIIFLFLLALPKIRKPVSIVYAGIMAILGVGYFIYWTYFKYGGA